tara:strand:+ start:5796 stop:8555 length:2760 start_codon:yes stop_codon:yes gene_type:complete
MALQASGPIKYTEIRDEFGDPLSTDTTNSYSVGWTYWTPPAPWVKSSDGVAGWYNSGIVGAWSQFMIDHAVYPSNTDPLVGTHQAIWRIGGESMDILPAGDYTLVCQVDNISTLYWDETLLGTVGSSSPEIGSSAPYNTDTSFDINIPSTTPLTQHYLTANVSNSPYSTPEGTIGVEFNVDGDLVVTGNGSKTIKLTFGFSDNPGDEGLAIGQYKIKALDVTFTQGTVRPSPGPDDDGYDEYPNGYLDRPPADGGSGNYGWPVSQTVTVEGTESGRVYSCDLIKPQNIIGDDGLNPISNAAVYENNRVADWKFRSNDNQRIYFKDNGGNDGNAAIWISEETETVGPVNGTGWYGLTDDSNGTYIVTGNINYNSVLPNHITVGNPNDWNINPAGVAWELKNSSGTVVRRSSDSFNYSIPSPNWGTLLQTYSVYASNIGSLVDEWHEADYLFDTNSSSTYTIEASADSQFQILLVENNTGDPTDVLSSENNESCNTGSCPISNALTITPNSTHRLRVRVYNASSTSVPTNSWLYNPGGIAFIVKDSSGNILKTSRDTGNQGSIESIGDGSSRFGNYRVSESFGSLVDVPLDTDAGVDLNLDIPKSGPIKFSNFYNARLNMAVDYYTGDTEYRPDTGRTRYNDSTKVRVIGGFKAKPTDPIGKKVILHINKLIGVDEDTKVGDYSGQSSKCAFRTGDNWGGSSTKIRIDVGSSGQVIGAGGNGGTTPDGSDSSSSPGNPGVSGTGALGVEHEGTVINVRTGGSVKAGCGGGGGGGNHGTDHGLSGENATGGGGGGGAGLPPGEGGIAGEGHEGDGGDGADGTISAGGAGGHGSDSGADGTSNDEAGAGGIGGEYSINHTNGLTAGQTGEQIGASGSGGAGGASGGAIRKTTGTTWTYGDEHVTDNVFGTGKGGAAESPIGVE